IVEMHSACFWISGSTLKPCLSILTPPGEPSVLSLSFDIHDRNGYSLPKNHTPMVLPLRSVGFLIPVSARQVISSPDFLNGWEMLTSGTPFSRDANADGIQSTMTSAPPPAITCAGAPSSPPGFTLPSTSP